MVRRRQADPVGRPLSLRVTRRDFWEGGVHNRAPADRLPNGFVRDLLNLDPLPGGSLALRTGYTRLVEGTAVRAALAVGDYILFADGSDLVEYHLRTHSSRVLREIDSSGPFTGAVLNGELFFSTASETLRYRPGGSVQPWGVPRPPRPQVTTDAAGGLREGLYRVYTTWFDGEREGPASRSARITLPVAGQALTLDVDPPQGYTARIYCTVENGSTAYRQVERSTAGTVLLGQLSDDTPALDTVGLQAPGTAEHITAYNGILLMAAGRQLVRTEPFRAHLVNPIAGWFRFAEDISVLQAVAGGVYVVADKTWFLAGADTSQPRQRWLRDMRAVPGTQALLPSGEAYWMSDYGPVFASPDGELETPAEEQFSPVLAQRGTAGIVEHNGNQTVVTSMRGLEQRPASLAAEDFFEAEVIQP